MNRQALRLTWAVALLAAAASARAQSQTPGIDVSRYQTVIDWTAVKNSGVHFAFMRATLGEGYVDPLFLDNIRSATQAGVLVGAYHFCRPLQNSGDPNDAVVEATHFLNVIKPYYDAGQFLVPVCDFEEFPAGGGSAANIAFVSNWVQKFSDTINSSLGVRPLIYTSQSHANTYYSSAIASQHDLWVAWYKAGAPANPPVAADTPKWGLYNFWQYSSTGTTPGISGNVDQDVFNGTAAQLQNYVIGSGPAFGLPTGRIVITDFDGANTYSNEATDGIEGYFSYNATPTASGSNVGITTLNATRVTDEHQFGPASQQITVDASAAWTLRHLAGFGASAGSAAANLPMESSGSIGFWLKTTSANVTAQMVLDDAPSGSEQSTTKAVVADGLWHLYEWQFDDANQWNNFASGNGTIDGDEVTMDSILFKGNGNATIYLDTVAYNANGSVGPPEGDFNGDYAVDADDYAIWNADFGATKSGADFLAWQRNLTAGPGGVSAATTVPEPAAPLLAAIALLLCGHRRPSSNRLRFRPISR